MRLSHLMHAGNLNYASALYYIDLLLKARLIEERTVGEAKVYYTTFKGLKLLSLFDEIESLIRPEIEPLIQEYWNN
jgi:predicted transcriptional regulator